MTRRKQRKCKHCKELFLPDYRNAKRQNHCQKPACRKAAKAESQKKWLEKPENADYFKGPDHVERVRQWRKEHPGYWHRKISSQNALQDHCRENTNKKQIDTCSFADNALQDYCMTQPSVLIGLIAHLTGFALQDDIANAIGRMQQLGNDILYQPNSVQGGQHVAKTPGQSQSYPTDPPVVRLGGSSPGP